LTDLLKELERRKIRYTNDEIPYNGRTDLRYRVFVIGCDIKKVTDLKEKYNEID
jgi:hypothetical protein